MQCMSGFIDLAAVSAWKYVMNSIVCWGCVMHFCCRNFERAVALPVGRVLTRSSALNAAGNEDHCNRSEIH